MTSHFDVMIVDNASKQAVAELQRSQGLPLISADKTGTPDFVEQMNAEFMQGRIKLGPGARELAEQCGSLVAWKRTYQYLSVHDPPPPTIGSPEWAEQEEEEMLQASRVRSGASKQTRWTRG